MALYGSGEELLAQPVRMMKADALSGTICDRPSSPSLRTAPPEGAGGGGVWTKKLNQPHAQCRFRLRFRLTIDRLTSSIRLRSRNKWFVHQLTAPHPRSAAAGQ